MNDYTRVMFEYWLNRGTRSGRWEDGSKFFCYYLCLNIIMANLSRENSDNRMLSWTKHNASLLSESYSRMIAQSSFSELVTQLQGMTPVADARLGINDNKTIRDIASMPQVLDVIYKVRCNLFHGNKLMTFPRNRDLVELSGRILRAWMKEIQISSMDDLIR